MYQTNADWLSNKGHLETTTDQTAEEGQRRFEEGLEGFLSGTPQIKGWWSGGPVGGLLVRTGPMPNRGSPLLLRSHVS